MAGIENIHEQIESSSNNQKEGLKLLKDTCDNNEFDNELCDNLISNQEKKSLDLASQKENRLFRDINAKNFEHKTEFDGIKADMGIVTLGCEDLLNGENGEEFNFGICEIFENARVSI